MRGLPTLTPAETIVRSLFPRRPKAGSLRPLTLQIRASGRSSTTAATVPVRPPPTRRVLQKLRSQGEGPVHRHHSMMVKYNIDDLLAWSQSQTRGSRLWNISPHRQYPSRCMIGGRWKRRPIQTKVEIDRSPRRAVAMTALASHCSPSRRYDRARRSCQKTRRLVGRTSVSNRPMWWRPKRAPPRCSAFTLIPKR